MQTRERFRKRTKKATKSLVIHKIHIKGKVGDEQAKPFVFDYVISRLFF